MTDLESLNNNFNQRCSDIDQAYQKKYPKLKSRNCIDVKLELVDRPAWIIYGFNSVCPDDDQLKSDIRLALENAVSESGLSGCSHQYM